MCVIVKVDQGGTFNSQYVWVYCRENPHGFGFMWHQDDRVKTINLYDTDAQKNADMAKELFEKFLESGVEFAFHCRYASLGEKNLANTHPFKILNKDDGDPYDLYMMHNGTIGGLGGEQKMSDTYNFATFYLRPLLKDMPDLINNENFQDLVEDLIGINKLIFLDSLGNWTILNESVGQQYNEKVWISNRFTPKETWTPPYTYKQPIISGFLPSHTPFNPQKDHRYDNNLGSPGCWTFDDDGRSNFIRIKVKNTDDELWNTTNKNIDNILDEVSILDDESEWFSYVVENPYESVDLLYYLIRKEPQEFPNYIKFDKTRLLLNAMSEPIKFVESFTEIYINSNFTDGAEIIEAEFSEG